MFLSKNIIGKLGILCLLNIVGVAGHAVLDFFTCFIWEIIGTPMELAFIATYDNYSYYVIFEDDKIIKMFDSDKYNLSDV